eukprot:6196125-Pleurochrysis_carterae.AAC.1
MAEINSSGEPNSKIVFCGGVSCFHLLYSSPLNYGPCAAYRARACAACIKRAPAHLPLDALNALKAIFDCTV